MENERKKVSHEHEEKQTGGFVCRCVNGYEALILPPHRTGPLADPSKAFTFSGMLRIDGDVLWGIHRWSVNGKYLYQDLGWGLVLDTMKPR